MSIQFQVKYLRETQVKETSGTGGATGASGEGASSIFKSGVGMEYTTDKVEEDASKLTTRDKLVLQAKKDKYITGDYSQVVFSAAKEVGDSFDRLKPEEQKVERDAYYNKFLQKAGLQEDAPMLAHGPANIKTYTKDGFKKTKRGTSGMKGVIPKDLWEDEGDTTSYTPDDKTAAEDSEIKLEEARNYHQFKREAATRTKAQQMHEAAKMINNKLDEINRLLEYTNQMRGELSEGEEQLEYKHNTKALFEKMNKKVVEAYTKLKKVK
jgi:hypothetical protein